MVKDIRSLDEEIMEETSSKNSPKSEKIINWKNWPQIYDFCSGYIDELYVWITNVLALEIPRFGRL
ncbi:hypothetical protein [Methanosarcina horonobensis]|uniref:hypothetical protein n=1 Tax=Methanosarcina horonobensis TaxID=418008 RepID=UPI000AC319C3|nr:hypothetical protein [Methanosarcina horonobensis]